MLPAHKDKGDFFQDTRIHVESRLHFQDTRLQFFRAHVLLFHHVNRGQMVTMGLAQVGKSWKWEGMLVSIFLLVPMS